MADGFREDSPVVVSSQEAARVEDHRIVAFQRFWRAFRRVRSGCMGSRNEGTGTVVVVAAAVAIAAGLC